MCKSCFYLLQSTSFSLQSACEKNGTWLWLIRILISFVFLLFMLFWYLVLSARNCAWDAFFPRFPTCKNMISRKVRCASVAFWKASKHFFSATTCELEDVRWVISLLEFSDVTIRIFHIQSEALGPGQFFFHLSDVLIPKIDPKHQGSKLWDLLLA